MALAQRNLLPAGVPVESAYPDVWRFNDSPDQLRQPHCLAGKRWFRNRYNLTKNDLESPPNEHGNANRLNP